MSVSSLLRLRRLLLLVPCTILPTHLVIEAQFALWHTRKVCAHLEHTRHLSKGEVLHSQAVEGAAMCLLGGERCDDACYFVCHSVCHCITVFGRRMEGTFVSRCSRMTLHLAKHNTAVAVDQQIDRLHHIQEHLVLFVPNALTAP